jgi:hypothetical protein
VYRKAREDEAAMGIINATAIVDTSLKDTIPVHLKPYFFANKRRPNLLEYDAIGFDADHCLVNRNGEALTRLLIKCQLKSLHEDFGYPEVVTKFDWSEYFATYLNNAVWDFDEGTVLKLVEGGIIAHATLGYAPLNQVQIRKKYGNPPIFHPLKWPESLRAFEKGKQD